MVTRPNADSLAVENRRDREIRAPGVLDHDVAELPPQCCIERDMIEQRIARIGHAFERPADHEYITGAAVELFGTHQQRKSAEQGRADAATAKNIEGYAALGKRLEDADVSRTEPTATGRNIAGRPSGMQCVPS